MEEPTPEQQKAVDKSYEYPAGLMLNSDKNSAETIDALTTQGVDSELASAIVANLEQQIASAKKEGAKKNMLYGALWCIGGIAATAADVGFIFWGAIVFGGIQFFKGVINA